MQYTLGRLVLQLGHHRACTADFAVDFHRRLQPHRIRDVRVDIQGRFRALPPNRNTTRRS